MKDKILYQRRTDGDYKGYTEDSFYFYSIEQLWCWKQTSTEKIFKSKTINELKQLKEANFIGKGNYEHKNDASLEKGQKIFKKCSACHTYGKAEANKVGPNLWNLINSPKANVEGFAYSRELAELGGTWGYE